MNISVNRTIAKAAAIGAAAAVLTALAALLPQAPAQAQTTPAAGCIFGHASTVATTLDDAPLDPTIPVVSNLRINRTGGCTNETVVTFSLLQMAGGTAVRLPVDVGDFSVDSSAGNLTANADRTVFTVSNIPTSIDSFDLAFTAAGFSVVQQGDWSAVIAVSTDGEAASSHRSLTVIDGGEFAPIRLVDENGNVYDGTDSIPLVEDLTSLDFQAFIDTGTGTTVAADVTLELKFNPNDTSLFFREGTSDGTNRITSVTIPAGDTHSEAFRFQYDGQRSARNNNAVTPDRRFTLTLEASASEPNYVLNSGDYDYPVGTTGKIRVPTFPLNVTDNDRPAFTFRDSSNAAAPAAGITANEGEMTPADSRFQVRITNFVEVSEDLELVVTGATPRETAQLAMPASPPITFAANAFDASSGPFQIATADDNIYYGTSTVNVTLRPAENTTDLLDDPSSFFAGSYALTVIDNDTPVIRAVAIEQSGSELMLHVGPAPGTPRIGVDLPVNIRVEAAMGVLTGTLPTSVTIPAGSETGTARVTLAAATDNVFTATSPGMVTLTVLESTGAHDYDVNATESSIARAAADPDMPIFAFVDNNGDALAAEAAISTTPSGFLLTITNGVTLDSDVTAEIDATVISVGNTEPALDHISFAQNQDNVAPPTLTINDGTNVSSAFVIRAIDEFLFTGPRTVRFTPRITAPAHLVDSGNFTARTQIGVIAEDERPTLRATNIAQFGREVHVWVQNNAFTAGPIAPGAEIEVSLDINATPGVLAEGPRQTIRRFTWTPEEQTLTIQLAANAVFVPPGSVDADSIDAFVAVDPNGIYQVVSGMAPVSLVNLVSTARPSYEFRSADGSAAPTNLMVMEGGRTTGLRVVSANGGTIAEDATLTPVGVTAADSARLAPNQASVVVPSNTASSEPNTVAIAIRDDNVYQGNSTVNVTLSATAPNDALANGFEAGQIAVMVQDNDTPLLQAVANGQSGGEVRFRVQPASGSPSIGVELPVAIQVDARPGLLAGETPTMVRFMGGEAFADVVLSVAEDSVYDGPPSSVSVTVAADPANIYQVAGGGPARQTVADPDVPVVQIGNAGTVNLPSEGGTATVEVLLAAGSAVLGRALDVNLSVSDPSGTLLRRGGGDLPGSVSVRIAAGADSAALPLDIRADSVYEGGGRQRAVIRLAESQLYALSATATLRTLTLTVPDDDAPSVRVGDTGDDVERVTDEDGTEVLQVGEGRTASFTFMTNYPPGTVLTASLSAGGERHLTLVSQRVTVAMDGSVTVEVSSSSVTRVQDLRLTLTAPSSPPAVMTLDSIVQPIRVDNDVDDAQADAVFLTGVPQTGGAEPGAWLAWLAAVSAVLLAGGGGLALRRVRVRR